MPFISGDIANRFLLRRKDNRKTTMRIIENEEIRKSILVPPDFNAIGSKRTDLDKIHYDITTQRIYDIGNLSYYIVN